MVKIYVDIYKRLFGNLHTVDELQNIQYLHFSLSNQKT